MKQIYLVLSILLITSFSFITKAQSGTIDPTFNPGTGLNNGYIYTTAIQNDGKIIIAGNFTSYNGTTKNNIARLNADGTLDGTFDSGIGTNYTGEINTTAIQSDGKIIIAGYFTSYNGITRNRIARLNANGTLDGTFDPGTGANYPVLTTAIQSDGKIIIAGTFSHYNETKTPIIARLNANGTLDETFVSGLEATGYNIFTTIIQSNGKIIITGTFDLYNGITANNIARLNTNGTLDATFSSGIGTNGTGDIKTTTIQNDGKIIIGGYFTSYNGTARNRIARLNADGTLDGTFDPGTGASYPVLATAIQNDGKIIIAGDFGAYNGTARSRIACLNTDASLDGTFNPGIGTNSTGDIYTASIQSDGKIIICGEFSEYSGTARNKIARIYSSITTSTFESSIQTTMIYPNPVKNELTIEINGNKEKTDLVIVNSIGQVVFKGNFINKTTVKTSKFTPGAYFVKLENGKDFEFKKIIKE